MSDEFLVAGFSYRAVYEIWLLAQMDLAAPLSPAGDRERQKFKRWVVDHENEIMEQVVDPAVEQVVRWYGEELGA